MKLAPEEFELDEDFDPLADDESEEEEEEIELVGFVEQPLDQTEEAPPEPEYTPEEKITLLFEKMPGRKKVLLEIINFCREPQPVSAVDDKVNVLQEHNFSVYTPVVLRQLLEEAGALEYLEVEQDDAEEDASSAEVEEPEYLEVKERPEGSWVATAAALSIVEAENPLQDLKDLLERDAKYLEIYIRILNFCNETPRTKKDIDAIVDDDPLVQEPRRFGGYFVDRLEKCDALAWSEKWSTTDVGRSVL